MTNPSVATEAQPLLNHDVVNESASTAISAEQSDSQSPASKPWATTVKVLGIMYCWFYCGITVTAIGALFANFKQYYNINNSTASLIFPAAICGYLIAALSLPFVARRGGWRAVAMITPICHVVATALLSGGPPFPITLGAYFVGGAGYGLCDAGFNAWASKQERANVVQGYLHSAFAIGSILGPVATLVVTENNLGWYAFYRGMLLLASLEVFILGYAFREDVPSTTYVGKSSAEEQPPLNLKVMKLTAYCCVFYFVYMAIESSFSDYIVSYMSAVRGMNRTRAALASSMFWVGMVIGRAGLGPFTERLGTAVAVSSYTFAAFCLQVVFRLVINNTASFVVLVTIGIFIGPMFPSAINLMGRKLSQQEVIIAASVAISVGQIGAALAPLSIGFMADRLGLGHLPDVILCLLVSLLLVWMVFAQAGR